VKKKIIIEEPLISSQTIQEKNEEMDKNLILLMHSIWEIDTLLLEVN